MMRLSCEAHMMEASDQSDADTVQQGSMRILFCVRSIAKEVQHSGGEELFAIVAVRVAGQAAPVVVQDL